MATNQLKSIKVFYSWQSDLSIDIQKALREVLRTAYTDIESEFSEIKIIQDEATRETSGSPDIPETIFQKIADADIFIADMTTINILAPAEQRKVPNPNVSIELGYAIANIGWQRIIILFNKAIGKFPDDLPFDISKRRILDFKITSKSDNSGKGQLKSELVNSLRTIVTKNPIKPIEGKLLSPEEKKRNSDIKTLKWAMNTVHIPYLDDFIFDMPQHLNGRIFYFWDLFDGIIKSNLFHIYDKKAKLLVHKFHKHWGNSLSKNNRYSSNPFADIEIYKFGSTFNFDRAEEEKDLQFLEKEKINLQKSFQNLLKYLRTEYLEINTSETSQSATQDYVNFHKELIDDAVKKTS